MFFGIFEQFSLNNRQKKSRKWINFCQNLTKKCCTPPREKFLALRPCARVNHFLSFWRETCVHCYSMSLFKLPRFMGFMPKIWHPPSSRGDYFIIADHTEL